MCSSCVAQVRNNIGVSTPQHITRTLVFNESEFAYQFTLVPMPRNKKIFYIDKNGKLELVFVGMFINCNGKI